MRLIKRKRTRHTDVHFYRNLVSDATGTQVMNLSHSLFFICNLQDFIFLSFWKTGIRQFFTDCITSPQAALMIKALTMMAASGSSTAHFLPG